jgi:hypothetical protein
MLNDYQRKLLLINGMDLAPTRRRKKVPLAVVSVDPGSIILDVKPLGTTLNTVEASSTAFVSTSDVTKPPPVELVDETTLSGEPPPEAVAPDVTKPPPVEKDVSQSLVSETSSEAMADVTQPLPESVDVSTVVAEPPPEIVDETTLATEAEADVTQPLPESVDVCTVVAEPLPEIVDETTLATEAQADVTEPPPKTKDRSTSASEPPLKAVEVTVEAVDSNLKGYTSSKKVSKKRKAAEPCVTRSKTAKKEGAIDVDKLPDIQLSDNSDSFFVVDANLSAEEKLKELMKSQFLGDKYDKSRLIALYVDEAGKDHPLYYIDVKRYRDKGWISNHFVGAYFFLLQRHFMSDNIKFLDTNFWSHYVQPPNNDRGVTMVSEYLSKYGITKDSHFVVPALISNCHFIYFEVDLSTKLISLYDSLGHRNSREILLLYDVLSLYIKDTEDWTMMDNFAKPSIARQTDMHSCGFFVCFYALSLATTSDVSSEALGEVDKTKKKIMMSLVDRKIYV